MTHTRRVFMVAGALGSSALVVQRSLPALAQGRRTPLSAIQLRVLDELGRSAARAYNEARRSGADAKAFRAAAMNLRVLAALDMDTLIRDGAADMISRRGAGTLLDHAVDVAQAERGLKERFGMDVAPEHLLARGNRAARNRALNQFLEQGASRQFRALADAMDGIAGGMARATSPAIRLAQTTNECQRYQDILTGIEFAAAVLCLIGPTAPCLAVLAQIALLQYLVSHACGGGY